jgi:hypothetical protein
MTPAILPLTDDRTMSFGLVIRRCRFPDRERFGSCRKVFGDGEEHAFGPPSLTLEPAYALLSE